jgi:hypothetical protein
VRDTPFHQAFFRQLERWLESARYVAPGCDDERDLRPLMLDGANLMRSGQMTLSDLAPVLAVFWFWSMEFETGRVMPLVMRLAVLCFKLIYRGRALWNDYYMALWQLSRDPRYVERLYKHLKKGNLQQKGTGEWMVTSVCQQDPEFKPHWQDLEAERGPVFDGDQATFGGGR